MPREGRVCDMHRGRPADRSESFIFAVPTSEILLRECAIFPLPSSPNAPLGVRAVWRSLFFPDIELARSSRNARAAGIFGLFRRQLAVIFGIHPDIGQITGRRVRI